MDSPRVVWVDDTDNNIKYNGEGWFQDNGSLDQIGHYGPPYLQTSHGTQSNTSLTFPFNGTNVQIYGTTEIRNVSGIVDPTWECFVDGFSILSFNPPNTSSIPADENNFQLCEQTFSDGNHQLTINITTRGSTFWIDNIQYVPSPSDSLDTASRRVDIFDPAISYSSGWQGLGDLSQGFAIMTNQTGATMQFWFIGKSISWYTYIPTKSPHAPATATYSIDGGTPAKFLISGLPASSETTTIYNYNQLLFTTPDLTPGLHTLLVTNLGNDSTIPLLLNYLIIANASRPNSSSSSSSSSASRSGFSSSISSSSTPTSMNHASGGSKTPIGEIVGAAVGGLIFLALFAFLFFWRRKKHLLENQAASNARQPHPFNLGDPTAESRFSNSNGIGPYHNYLLNPSPRYDQVTRKQREMGADQSSAAPRTATTPNFLNPSLPQTNSSNGNGNDIVASRIVVHADSGLRIP